MTAAGQAEPITEDTKLAWVAPTLDVCPASEAEFNAGGASDGLAFS